MEKKEINNDLLRLFRAWHGSDAAVVERLAGAGSNRMYVRLTGDSGQTVVGVEGTCVEENAAFVYLSRHFAGHGLPVPQVLAVSDDGLCYLQQDLGSTSLFDAIAEGRRAGGRYNERERQLLLKTIRLLPQFQVKGAQGLDFARCYRQSVMDVRSVMFDLNYFKYCFLLPSGIAFDEVRLEEDFGRLAQSLVQDVGDFFLYRDFQARNVMLVDNDQPYFIDFQGGRRGSFYYDVASFVWQASACYPDELRRQLVDAYYDELKALTEVPPRQVFDERLLLFVFFRTLQVLGAYGFRGWFERKAHFINSIPAALGNLHNLIEKHVADDYPYLKEVLKALLASHLGRVKGELKGSEREVKETIVLPINPSFLIPHPLSVSALVVRVFSFSYKKGIPEDESGNGGGYVFDCRSTHNPGRYEQYKSLTGLDEPVIRFLEDDGEILRFLEHVYQLAEKHVERYLERGFTSLMFSFGCTGGQHRSVYAAQHLAEHLHNKYGIEVRLCHREQNIVRTFSKGGNG